MINGVWIIKRVRKNNQLKHHSSVKSQAIPHLSSRAPPRSCQSIAGLLCIGVMQYPQGLAPALKLNDLGQDGNRSRCSGKTDRRDRGELTGSTCRG